MCCQYIGKGLLQMPLVAEWSNLHNVFPFILPVLDTERHQERCFRLLCGAAFSAFWEMYSEPLNQKMQLLSSVWLQECSGWIKPCVFFFNQSRNSFNGWQGFFQAGIVFICINNTSMLLRKFVFHTRESAVFWYFLASHEKIVLAFISVSFL